MLDINTIVYGLIAGFFIGLHVFSLKIIQLKFDYTYYTLFLVLGSFSLWLISRLFLLLSFETTTVSSFAYALLMIGLLVSILLDNIILHKPIQNPMIYLGIFFILIGYFIIVQYGY